jgi:hypothetical protein
MKLATALLAEMSGTIAIARILGSPKAEDILRQKRVEIKKRLGLPDENAPAGKPCCVIRAGQKKLAQQKL